MPNLVIYTAVTGHYDELGNVYEEPSVDYICFTDYNFTGTVPKPWKQIKLPPSNFSDKDLARYCKLNPHVLLPQYQHSLWIDGNIRIKGKIRNFIIDILSKHRIAAYEHWWRDKTEQEFHECARSGFDPAWKLYKQIERYKHEGYTSSDFFENNILMRNHMESDIIKMHEIWWGEYISGGKRDQFSFTYAAYKSGVNIYSLGVHDARVIKQYFDYVTHSKKRPLKQYIWIIINRIYISLTRWSVNEPSRTNKLVLNNERDSNEK
ncbi:glycosyltransferase domain-containing protein [Escherichia coli]|uniref:glycosyltransferase domain-containing protein n=1 Tax=Escherichia coli TaxID=562 RepID=UPI000BE1D68C|nr:glycosyltransferase domain-containing protein [Escherichia coli]